MPFNRPSLQDIIDRMISDFNTRVQNSVTFLRRSAFRIMARVYAGAVHLLYSYLAFMKDQLFVSTADAEHLERHGSEYGINRSFGAKATGSGTAVGTNGSVIEAGTKLRSATENVYTVDSNVTIGAGGTGVISFTADTVGTAHNEDAGVTLTFISPPPGVISNVIVDSDGITGGSSRETDEQYRLRILTRKRQPPHGGIAVDYVNWAKEYSGVTRAWSIPKYQGPGTIGIAFVRDGDTDIFPDETQRNAVKNYIISHTDTSTGKVVGIPVTAEPGFFVIENGPLAVNLSINISPNNAAVRAAVTSNIEDLILQRGGAEQTIYFSQIYEAVSGAVGEDHHEIVGQADITAAANQVHVLGTITFGDYNG